MHSQVQKQYMDLFGKPVAIFYPDTNWKQQYVELLAASIRMIANCILLAFAQDYLKTEQSDGTPFTLAGAKKLKNLGIRCIWIPIVAIVVAVTVAVWLGEESIGEAGNAFSLTTGIALILVSMVFRYGAELERQLHGKIENYNRRNKKSSSTMHPLRLVLRQQRKVFLQHGSAAEKCEMFSESSLDCP